MRCEWSNEGYCEVYGSSEEQKNKETQWECNGTEEEMLDCGQIREAIK